MADDIKPGFATESTTGARPADSKALDYAFWQTPDSSFKVTYSVALFHEIDFVVNEGYRKIPHGGIEEGGLLFGVIQDDGVRIEAFRSINCEHASGPSFVLSERDMAALELQLMAASSDPDLEHLLPVGWFLTHTRGALSMTDLEVAQFDKLFPQVSRLTVLIKPERFQPTRFGFLVRDANREMPRDATASAIILPLPGRTGKQGSGLIPSIPAPAPSANGRRLAQAAELEEVLPPHRVRPERTSAQPLSELAMPGIWKDPPSPEEAAQALDEHELEEETAPLEEPDLQKAEAQRTARKQLARERTRVIEESLDVPGPLAPERPPKAQPKPPPFAIARPLPERTVSHEVYEQIAEFKARSTEPVINARSLSILAIAALLGCLVGYVLYLQMPGAVIALEVHGQPQAQTITVSWQPDITRNAVYASVRVNNSEPVPLSPEEKTLGRVELNAPGDVKVEVIAQNWMRDSRGIVHYLRSGNGSAGALP
jgi:hypothetical protein